MPTSRVKGDPDSRSPRAFTAQAVTFPEDCQSLVHDRIWSWYVPTADGSGTSCHWTHFSSPFDCV